MISFPQAKLNLGLNVLRRRDDGYHDIESLFIPFGGMQDILEILPHDTLQMHLYGLPLDGPTVAGGDSVGSPMAATSHAGAAVNPVAGSPIPATTICPADPGETTAATADNLCIKAWKLLNEEFGIPPVAIHLYKGIPAGAGLGGGSSDAAATILMLNEMFSLGLSAEECAVRAARLGSDCPFFIYGRPMLARGRGEILTPFDIDLTPFRIEVVVPPVHISTKEAYSKIRAAVPPEPISEILKGGVESWRGRLKNDFEDSVFPAHPEIEAAKGEMYRRGALYASMSGSGSSVFGIFNK